MKKKILFMALLSIGASTSVVSAQAQRSIKTSPITSMTLEQAGHQLRDDEVAQDGIPLLTFENENEIDDWVTFDVDEDGHTWAVTYFVDEDQAPLDWGNNGSRNQIISQSWDGATQQPLSPDNYFISPKIAIQSGDILTFFVKTMSANYPTEKYEVLLNTVSIESSNWSQVFIQTLEKKDTVWTQKEIDLSAYAGTEAYIAFRHFESTDNFTVAIDDIYLGETTTSLGETQEAELNIFPNPAQDFIQISHKETIKTLSIYSLAGKEVLVLPVNSIQTRLELGHLKKGLYLIKAETEKGLLTETISIRY